VVDARVDLGYDSFHAVQQSELPVASVSGERRAQRAASKRQILAQYRAIHLGYDLLGDDLGNYAINWLVSSS